VHTGFVHILIFCVCKNASVVQFLADYELHCQGTSFEQLTNYWMEQQQQVIKIALTMYLFEVCSALNPYDSFGNIKFDPRWSNSITVETAESANMSFKKRGYKHPFKPGTQTYTVEIAQKTKVGEYVRVYGDESGKGGQWFMRAGDVKGLTPQQIQNKFALPQKPTHITDVIIKRGTTIRYSTANEIRGWGDKAVVYNLTLWGRI
jgi:hypothetical protein